MPMKIPASTALVSCDGLGGYDWTDQAEEGSNYALMAYTSTSFDSKVLKVEIQMKEIAIKDLRRKLEVAQKEKDSIQLDKFKNASKSFNKLIDCQIVDNCKKGLGYENYNAVPPPYTGNFMPPKPDLSFTGLDEFPNKPVVENTKSSVEETKAVRKNTDAPIIEEWVSDNKEETVSQPKIEKNNYKEIDGGYVAFGGNPKGGRITRKAKFDGKADEGFFVGYSSNSKAFRVFNSRTRIVEENLHVRFSENTPNVVGSGLDWLFDIDALTRTMNYKSIVAGTQSNGFVGTKASNNAGQARKSSHDDGFKPLSDDGKKVDEDLRNKSECKDQEKEDNVNNTNNVNTVSLTVNVAGTNKVNFVGELQFDPNMSALEDVGTFDFSNKDEDDDVVVDMNNLDTTIQVGPTLTTRIHKDHPLDQVIEDLKSATQTRNMTKNLEEHGFVSTIQQRTN
nr:putative ribonuclease H-like domain-containing protein [Tanacetum cinerariifolium]